MAMALGYEDANDAARLACDPIHKLLATAITIRIVTCRWFVF
jgi:hypothetical protein